MPFFHLTVSAKVLTHMNKSCIDGNFGYMLLLLRLRTGPLILQLSFRFISTQIKTFCSLSDARLFLCQQCKRLLFEQKKKGSFSEFTCTYRCESVFNSSLSHLLECHLSATYQFKIKATLFFAVVVAATRSGFCELKIRY